MKKSNAIVRYRILMALSDCGQKLLEYFEKRNAGTLGKVSGICDFKFSVSAL